MLRQTAEIVAERRKVCGEAAHLFVHFVGR